MLRHILIAFVLLCFTISAIFVALIQFWGWKGLLAFPFVIALLGLLLYFLIKKLFMRLALGLFSIKSRVLRGAKLTVHSVSAVVPPTQEQSDGGDGQREYVEVDLTITPKGSDVGRVWEPGELILTSKKLRNLMELEDGEHELGIVEEVKVWDGKKFAPDDPGKYPGEQRLKLTFSVKPGTAKAWLHYYAETIGVLELPKPRA